MNDGRFDQRDSYDTLYVPFVWVPDGAPQPTEWLSQHPDAFWVPATLMRGPARNDGATDQGHEKEDRLEQSDQARRTPLDCLRGGPDCTRGVAQTPSRPSKGAS